MSTRSGQRRRGENGSLEEIAADSTTRCPVRGREGESGSAVGGAGEQLHRDLYGVLRRGIKSTSSPTGARTRPATLPARGHDLDELEQLSGREAGGVHRTEHRRRWRRAHQGHGQGLQDGGTKVFDYGDSPRNEARQDGFDRFIQLPRLRPRLRPAPVLRLHGRRSAGSPGPATRPTSTPTTTTRSFDLFRTTNSFGRLGRRRGAGEKITFQGLQAPDLLATGQGRRREAGLLFDEIVTDGRLFTPLVISSNRPSTPARWRRRSRETQAIAPIHSDAIADSPLLDAIVDTRTASTSISIPTHGGGVGMGASRSAPARSAVANGTELATDKLARSPRDEQDRHRSDPPHQRRSRRRRRRRREAGRPGPDLDERGLISMDREYQERRSMDVTVPDAERHGSPRSPFTLSFGASMRITAVVDGALTMIFLAAPLCGDHRAADRRPSPQRRRWRCTPAQGTRLGLPQIDLQQGPFGVFGEVMPLILVAVAGPRQLATEPAQVLSRASGRRGGRPSASPRPAGS